MNRKVVSYLKLDKEMLHEIDKQFPSGFGSKVQKIRVGEKDYFYAFEMIVGDTDYLIKLPKKWKKELGIINNNNILYGD